MVLKYCCFHLITTLESLFILTCLGTYTAPILARMPTGLLGLLPCSLSCSSISTRPHQGYWSTWNDTSRNKTHSFRQFFWLYPSFSLYTFFFSWCFTNWMTSPFSSNRCLHPQIHSILSLILDQVLAIIIIIEPQNNFKLQHSISSKSTSHFYIRWVPHLWNASFSSIYANHPRPSQIISRIFFLVALSKSMTNNTCSIHFLCPCHKCSSVLRWILEWKMSEKLLISFFHQCSW